jgi:hypothetical protein
VHGHDIVRHTRQQHAVEGRNSTQGGQPGGSVSRCVDGCAADFRRSFLEAQKVCSFQMSASRRPEYKGTAAGIKLPKFVRRTICLKRHERTFAYPPAFVRVRSRAHKTPRFVGLSAGCVPGDARRASIGHYTCVGQRQRLSWHGEI